MLKGKAAIITGAAQGIGKGIGEVFAENGAKVVIADLSLERATVTAKAIADTYGVETLALPVDVSEEAQVHDMVKKTVEKFGTVDILVNNAGINGDNLPIEEITYDIWFKIWKVNFMGTVFCTQAVIPYMKKQRSGRIINLSSMSTERAKITSSTAYAASKAAINMLTRSAANFLGPFNITVNGMAPGLIATEMTQKFLDDKNLTEEQVAAEASLGKKLGKPRDVGNTALYLAGPLGDYITGTIVDINGGIFMR